MNCKECQEYLVPYLEGLLDFDGSEKLKRHLEECTDCSALAEEHASLHERLVRDGSAPVQGEMDRAVMDRIFREQAIKSRRYRKIVFKRRLFAAVTAAAMIMVVAVLGSMVFDWPVHFDMQQQFVSKNDGNEITFDSYFDRIKPNGSVGDRTAASSPDVMARKSNIIAPNAQLDEATVQNIIQLGYDADVPPSKSKPGTVEPNQEALKRIRALGYVKESSTQHSSTQGGGIYAMDADSLKSEMNAMKAPQPGAARPEAAAGYKKMSKMGYKKMSKMADGTASTVSLADTPMLGFSVGGAKDITNFRKNIENDFLPIPTDITYEGLYYDYFFDTGELYECDDLFYPTYCAAVTRDPFSKRDEFYLTVGMNSGLKSLERKKLNLVVVLDVSGSMKKNIDVYHYDRQAKTKTSVENMENVEKVKNKPAPKIEVAKESLLALLDHLKSDDRFGLVIFSDQGQLVKPAALIGDTDMDALRNRIKSFGADGSTNMSSGMDIGIAQINAVIDHESTDYENRIIFITDAQPNQGELNERGLLGKAKANAANRIYTTFIGIGVDFNSELIEAITKMRGANYYCAGSGDAFRKRMDDEFEFMVTPLVFGLELNLESGGYRIDKVYGSPDAAMATGTLLKINTLFPSRRVGGETKGGVVLLKLSRKLMPKDYSIFLSVKYEDRDGKEHTSSRTVRFSSYEPDYFANTGIRKAVLLARYANLLKDWLIDMRIREVTPAANASDQIDYLVSEASGIIVPPKITPELGRWERMSRPLAVGDHYRALFDEFKTYFEGEMKSIGDDTLKQETEILNRLSTK